MLRCYSSARVRRGALVLELNFGGYDGRKRARGVGI
jgi:hypothetical protein